MVVDVVMVRVYFPESAGRDPSLVKRLRDWGHIRGATLFQGVSGWGDSEEPSTGPLILEFFETPEKAREVLDYLESLPDAGHIVYWPAKMVVPDGSFG